MNPNPVQVQTTDMTFLMAIPISNAFPGFGTFSKIANTSVEPKILTETDKFAAGGRAGK